MSNRKNQDAWASIEMGSNRPIKTSTPKDKKRLRTFERTLNEAKKKEKVSQKGYLIALPLNPIASRYAGVE